MKVNSLILPILTLKLIAMTMSLEPPEKGIKPAIYIPTIWWKFGESDRADPEIALVEGLLKTEK